MIYPEHITSTNHNYTAPLRIPLSHKEIGKFLWLLTDLEAYWWGLVLILHVIESSSRKCFSIFIFKGIMKGLQCHSYTFCLFDHRFFAFGKHLEKTTVLRKDKDSFFLENMCLTLLNCVKVLLTNKVTFKYDN